MSGSEDENHAVVENATGTKTFKDLGVVDVLCTACEELKWKSPSKIQEMAIPKALEGKDVIGLAETGSGKTGAFALPILQSLLENPQKIFALVLTPTRELAFQISEQFTALGKCIGIKTVVLVGGMDMKDQKEKLANKPHIIIATPGRLVDHIQQTKGFSIKSIKYLVMDEADRILNLDFEREVDTILREVPRQRHTYLFSATMTKKVAKLQRASLTDPVKVEVSTRNQTVDKLDQFCLVIPAELKNTYLVSILSDLCEKQKSVMVFCMTRERTQRVTLLLRNLGLTAIPLHGKMTQDKRLGSLNKYKSKSQTILVTTDVASRGLDIPHVDVVLNYDTPTNVKDYIHRVGRTARAGREGTSITFVTQYSVQLYADIEMALDKKLPLWPITKDEVMVLKERVMEAEKYAETDMVTDGDKKGKKRKQEEPEPEAPRQKKFAKKKKWSK